LDNEILWASFGKELQDFTVKDMTKLISRSLDLCCQFYEIYVKQKDLGSDNRGHVRVEEMYLQLQ